MYNQKIKKVSLFFTLVTLKNYIEMCTVVKQFFVQKLLSMFSIVLSTKNKNLFVDLKICYFQKNDFINKNLEVVTDKIISNIFAYENRAGSLILLI